ncbi:MAG: D-2-hydroxyacid dehydrogenase [Chloroflexota bacterium]|nr:D-2-hydroxyacid dehydrogenase [Chloroflexota bacterium]
MLVVTNLAELTDRHVGAIQAVDPRIELKREGERDAAAYARRLEQAEVFFGMRVAPDLPQRAPKLRWLASTLAGVDALAGTGLLEQPFAVTTMKGIHRVSMGEHIMSVMLMWVRGMPRFLQAQREGRWLPPAERPRLGELWGSTLGVVGLGNIGDEVARRAKAFDMRVLATRRHVGPKDAGSKPAYVDRLLPASELDSLLSDSDFVLLALPLTGETRGILGERELGLMKPSGVLINISRGAVLDEPALIEALRTGRIGGAALDVFATEPLAAGSPLWDLPNVILTPHISGQSVRYWDRIVELFCENLRRYLAGEELINRYDPNRGY